MKDVKKLLLKIVFATSALLVLTQKDKYILKSGLPVTKKEPANKEDKPKISLKTTLLKLGFAAASLIMLSTTGSVALNEGLPLANNNTTNTKREPKEETLGTKMYVYGSDDARDIPAGLIHWSGSANESVYLSFNSLSKNFTDDHNLKSLGTLSVPMFYMMDQLEPGKPPVYYVSADPHDGGKVLGPVSTNDAKIYVVKDNLTGRIFTVSYDEVKQIENNIGVRYIVIGVCDRKIAMKYGCSLDSSEPYRDFAQNTVISAFLPAENNKTNQM